jgi:hypothetical protein
MPYDYGYHLSAYALTGSGLRHGNAHCSRCVSIISPLRGEWLFYTILYYRYLEGRCVVAGVVHGVLYMGLYTNNG